MRVAGPQPVTILSRIREFYSRGTIKRRKILRLLSLLAVILLVGAVSTFVIIWNNKSSTGPIKIAAPRDSAQENIKEFKNSTNIDEMRSLAAGYIAVSDYGAAANTAKQVAQKTGEIKDYLTLLTICATRDVPNKQACIDQAVTKLKDQLSKLSFYNTYTAGSVLDQAGDKKNAVTFYQRALEIYDPARADEYVLTKEQLKKRIDELSK